MSNLLSRDQFREKVFARDRGLCVICNSPAQDAHHIIDRRLFPDGGYYLDNGASLCGKCHIKAEQTVISCEEIRQAAGITRTVIPPHLYSDYPLDKWGNMVLPNGQRLKGELMNDPSVLKILESGGILSCFSDLVKYPRTYHLPWSESVRDDDRVQEDLSEFIGKRVIVTEKMDGENTSCYHDDIHARSIDSRNHDSRNWVKNLWSSFRNDIPKGWRICGENLFATHSIHYSNLQSYFYVFSVWDDRNYCLAWDDTVEWAKLLGLEIVPVLYDGIWDEKTIRGLYLDKDWQTKEGYVVRTAHSFHYSQFRKCVAKYVRKNHVQTEKHWMYGCKIVTNDLKK